MLAQQQRSPRDGRLAATVAHDGEGHICSREGCGRPAPLRVAVWFLVWWSCSRHLDELIELIQEHGFPVTYAQVPVNPVTPDASS